MTYVKTNYCEFGDFKDVLCFMKENDLKEIKILETGFFAGTLNLKHNFSLTLEEIKELAK